MGPSHNEIKNTGKESRGRQKLLDLGSSNESIFRYDMEDILADSSTSEDRVPSLVASIWSKASRLGINDAKDFIKEKVDEGMIDPEAERKLLRLLDRNSKYR